MVKTYGEGAALKALDRADRLKAGGDVAGATIWLLIGARVAELQEPPGSA
jgi:hypothetical protein